MRPTTNSASVDRHTITDEFILHSGSHPISILIDSGADGSIIDEAFGLQLGLQLEPLPSPVPARALDGYVIGQVNNKNSPVGMLLPGDHAEYIQLIAPACT